ncbi:Mobile element protein (plasmid) [Raoultella ornithinolytica]|nr:Mobile element protein [Raoultella ornithinolytica]
MDEQWGYVGAKSRQRWLGFYAGTAEISGMSRDVMPRLILNNEEQSYSL